MQYKIISISGEVGSGKSSIAKALLEFLPGWERVNTGQHFRNFCASKGMEIEQVSELSDDVHREFDRTQQQLLQDGERLVIEGRLSGWLARDIQRVFRVYCSAPFHVRVERYIGRENKALAEAEENIRHRDENDLEKFRHIYQVADYRDPCYYHLLLDTSTAPPDSLAQQVLHHTGLVKSL